MNWYLIALIPPLLDSFTNHIDKHLVSKYFKGGGNGALLIFSSLIGFLVFPVIYVFNPGVLNIELKYALLLILNGFLTALILLPYFHALEKDEASIVIPLYQTIPIFSFFLAFFVLGETLSLSQIAASLLIIFGAITLSLDLSERKPRLKKDIFWLMMLSSFLYALTSLIFKFVAVSGDYWTSLFWEYIGLSIAGILLFAFVPAYRNQFLSVVKLNKSTVLGINILNETIHVFSAMALHFATLLAPLTLVWVASGFQPLFVLIIGVAITIFLPRLGVEKITKKHLFHKFFAIIMMLLGTLLLNI